MHYILTSRKSFPSARLLRDVFKLNGVRLFITDTPRNKAPLIRYGNVFGDYVNDTNLNSKEFIFTVSNKRTFSELLLSNGFYTPDFIKSEPEENDYPVVVRRYLNSCKGKGIVICRNREEFIPNRGYYWTPWVNVTSEFRVHIVGGKISRLFRKVLSEGEECDEFPIRTSDKYHFSLIENNERFPKLVDLVSNLNGVLGDNNFYALDIGWVKERSNWFIFEANSAPGLNENTAQIYYDFINSNLGAI